MQNEVFKHAIFDALTSEYENIVPTEQEDHFFSAEFEKKMSKLIKRRKKPYFMIINTVGKRVACFIIGIVIASSLAIVNVESIRNAFIDFFMNIFEKFSIVQSVDTDKSPQIIEEIYEITYDLSLYNIDYEEQNEIYYNIVYKNENNIINYTQWVKSEYDMHINTEDAIIETIIINNYEAIYFIDNHNYHHLIWDNGKYIIDIHSNIGKNELIVIANSVQKAE